jgi:choline kinase
MQPVEHAVIAAAGLGSRLGLGLPKCMININDEPIISKLIRVIENHVNTIIVVVGYREELVIEYISSQHPNVVLVRNPYFRETHVTYSYALGAKYLKGKCIFIDGDLIIDQDSISRFIYKAGKSDILVGLTEPKSEDAVYALVSTSGGNLTVNDFSRAEKSKYEWANIVSGPPDLINDTSQYVFENIMEHLPAKGSILNLCEIDTTKDLELACKFFNYKQSIV